MVFVADDLASWLLGQLAGASRRRLTVFVLGDEQERALRSAATAAVRLTATELCPEGGEREEQLGIDALAAEASALEGIGRCDLAAGLPNKAATPLRRALAIYQRIGSPNAQRVEMTLRDHAL